jgi:threonine/homoserine/homoserine lactone efflux protein
MHLYALFLVVATATVCSPGPGVVMTLTHSLRHGPGSAFAGIAGIAFGALLVAAVSVTGLGLLLAASALAFTVVKLVGAAYLAWLGVRLWCAPPLRLDAIATPATSWQRRFVAGLSLQVTNPKAVIFFLSVFPQFIDPGRSYPVQFAILVATYAGLVVSIHSIYARFAGRARNWLGTERGARTVNRVAGTAFMAFGAALATAKR